MVSAAATLVYIPRETLFKTIIETTNWKKHYISTKPAVEAKCACSPLFNAIGLSGLFCRQDITRVKQSLDKEFTAYSYDKSSRLDMSDRQKLVIAAQESFNKLIGYINEKREVHGRQKLDEALITYKIEETEAEWKRLAKAPKTPAEPTPAPASASAQISAPTPAPSTPSPAPIPLLCASLMAPPAPASPTTPPQAPLAGSISANVVPPSAARPEPATAPAVPSVAQVPAANTPGAGSSTGKPAEVQQPS